VLYYYFLSNDPRPLKGFDCDHKAFTGSKSIFRGRYQS